jgi:acyl-coenzyme A thioesterase PaaI-like protein
MNYIKPIKVDSPILIEAMVRRIGKTTAFSECYFYKPNLSLTKPLLFAYGTHLKACMDMKFPLEFSEQLKL